MQSAAQRRQRRIFAEKEGQIVVQTVGVLGCRGDHENRLTALFGRQSQDVSHGAALQSLKSFRSGPLPLEKAAKSLFGFDAIHPTNQKKGNRRKRIVGMGFISARPAASTSLAQFSMLRLRSATLTPK